MESELQDSVLDRLLFIVAILSFIVYALSLIGPVIWWAVTGEHWFSFIEWPFIVKEHIIQKREDARRNKRQKLHSASSKK